MSHLLLFALSEISSDAIIISVILAVVAMSIYSLGRRVKELMKSLKENNGTTVMIGNTKYTAAGRLNDIKESIDRYLAQK